MRFLKTLFVAIVAVGFTATAAHATLSITLDNNTGGAALGIGDSFEVTVTVGYDGNPPQLQSIFTSVAFDPTVLQFDGTTGAQPFAIFFGAQGFLSKIADAGPLQADPDPNGPGGSGVIRAVQYGANPGQSGGAGPDTLIATLLFSVVGVGDGSVTSFTQSDEGSFAGGVEIAPQIVHNNTSVSVVPEPGTALLMGLGLAGLGVAGRRTR